MPVGITVEELQDSRQWSGGSVTLRFKIAGTDDDLLAKAALYEQSGDTYPLENDLGDLRREDHVTVEPLAVDEVTHTGLWLGTVRYSPWERTKFQTGESSFSFDTTGGTQHITQSLANVARYAAPGETAPDFKGAISVTKDSVEGVDITVPVYAWSETHYIAAGQVTDAYKAKLFNLTGKTNTEAFRGMAAGECLFLGASGSQRSEEDWEITFKFAGSPNRTNMTVGAITEIDKKGWEYLWVRYKDTEDATGIIKTPVAAYVEKVYRSGDFGDLGI